MITQVKGDLFDSQWEFDAIGHGVNCFGMMGAGIAVQFKNRYPRMHDEYRKLCGKGWLLPGQVFPWDNGTGTQAIFNIASQYAPGPDAKLSYLHAGLQYVDFYMKHTKRKHLGLPWIGAGIGGLDIDDVLLTINQVFVSSPIKVTVVEFGG